MAAPVAVDVDTRRAVSVTFDDGVEAVFALADLRAACPCAGCRGKRERGLPSWEPRPGSDGPTLVDASFVGAWGLSLQWDDGHDGGIFAWDLLRSWCDREAGE
jgi:DUF971 family protein